MNYSMGNWPTSHQIVEPDPAFTRNSSLIILYRLILIVLIPLVWMSNWCRSWQLADPGPDTVLLSLVTTRDSWACDQHPGHHHYWPRHLSLFDNHLHQQIFGTVWSHLSRLESVSGVWYRCWRMSPVVLRPDFPSPTSWVAANQRPVLSGDWPIRGRDWTIFTVVVDISDTRSTWCEASHRPPGHGANCFPDPGRSWDFLQNEKPTCYWWIKINGQK